MTYYFRDETVIARMESEVVVQGRRGSLVSMTASYQVAFVT